VIAFIEGKLFYDKRRNLIGYERLGAIYWMRIVIGFIER
jgi:hypothetical protein